METEKEVTEEQLTEEELYQQQIDEAKAKGELPPAKYYPPEPTIRDICKKLGLGWTGDMDGYLRKNLDQAKKVIKKDWDMVMCIDGYEGAGKSVLAQQCALYCDPTFNVDRCCFTPEDFIHQINNSQPYQAVIYDEAYGGMSSRAALSEVNRSLMAVLAEIRQKNLFVFIVLPCFFELDKYAAVWRARALLHVYTGDNFERGRFSFYNQDRKKALYASGKKFFSYKFPTPNFIARFAKGYAVDEVAYREKKLAALKAREEKPQQTAMQIRHNKLIGDLINMLVEQGLTLKNIADRVGMAPTNMSKYSLLAKRNGGSEE